MRYYVYVDGERIPVELEEGRVRVGGEELEVELAPGDGGGVRSARVDGRSLRVIPSRDRRGEWALEVDGARYRVEVLDRGQEAAREAGAAGATAAGPSPLRAPMPGLVVRVEVAPGEAVQEGQGVVIVEAMKMENELRAVAAARVTTVWVEEGQAVERDQVLVEFGTLDGSS